MIPDAELYLRPVPPESTRKTRYTTVMVKHEGMLISLVSILDNRFVYRSLESCQLTVLKEFRLEKSEVALGNHRFDFLLKTDQNTPFYLEVKSVTFVEDGLTKFSDAVTKRGIRHGTVLENMVMDSQPAGVLFVCQRPDAQKFSPMYERDPKFSTALERSYQSGVKI